jgi:hypothetical protein
MATAVQTPTTQTPQPQPCPPETRTPRAPERTVAPATRPVFRLDWWALKLWLAGFAILAVMHLVELLARAIHWCFGS